MKKNPELEYPEIELLESEVKRMRYKRRYRRTLKSTLAVLVVVAAISVLVVTLWMPVLRIYGASMTPTLVDGDIVISVKENRMETGDIVAFYYNNKILVKRMIADSGEWVDMDPEGTVYVNSVKLEEPYITEPSRGDCNISFPYQVPESRIFVMGDDREVSVDSRNAAVGCIAEEQIVGRLVFRLWPLSEFGAIR